MRVLIVEDSRSLASKIVKAIRSWGYEAERAGTGKDALEKLRRDNFDIVLLDIYLPDGKSIDLIPKLREFCPDIEIITMTAFNSRELEMDARQYGILYYMLKPFESAQLKEILDHMSNKLLISINHKKEGILHGRIS
ncbi:MAG: response regulator [Deltaproteobacteria bacterium]|nr:response regulator [Deltaproteobacteria bacterium]HEN21181.1 response regulator [Desulfobacteraceae bacterium]